MAPVRAPAHPLVHMGAVASAGQGQEGVARRAPALGALPAAAEHAVVQEDIRGAGSEQRARTSSTPQK
eukprot:11261784-Alexandrium_andersonii.AAC.1